MSKQAARLCRQLCNTRRTDNVRVILVPGSEEPHIEGMGSHYVTRGGRRIWHPTAYAKTGFGNMIYVASTRRIEVGADWINSIG